MMMDFLKSESNIELAKMFFLMVIVWMLYGMLRTTILSPFMLVAGLAITVIVGLKFYLFLYPRDKDRDDEEYRYRRNDYEE